MPIERSIAILEAGRVLMDWFLDCATEIKIDMHPRNRHAPRVRGRRGPNPSFVNLLTPGQVVSETMDSLAGPAAEYKYLGWSDDGRTIEDRFEQWEVSQNDPYDNIGRAIEFAIARHGNNDAGIEFVHTVAGWTNELIDVPQVWTGLNALADRLQVQRKMDGEAAIEIMQQASGFKSCPLIEIGQPWLARCRDWHGTNEEIH